MAAAFDSSGSRSWWPMARSQSGPATGYIPEKPKSKSKTKTLNAFFGLKSKKNPSVAIQDPPLPIQPIPPEHIPQSFANRPPSKSVSSVISRADSLGPRTPSDFHPLDHSNARQSLLTLSDSDPFASSRSIGTVSSPYQPTDPTRLSAYSNTSSNDHIHRKNVDLAFQQRTSYGSSSSQSQNYTNGPESPLPLSPSLARSPGGSPKGKLLNKRSDTALNGSRRTESTGQPSPLPNSGASMSWASSNSSSRPPLRPRGLTDNGTTQQSGFFIDRRPNVASVKPADPQPFPNAPSPSRPHPRVVVRQASLQHLSNPAPPPTQRLPAPPQSLQDGATAWPQPQTHRPHTAESITSPISFASATSSKDSSPVLASPPARTRRISDRSIPAPSTADADKERSGERSKPSLTPLSPPMTLKKAISHQSLLKRGPLFSSSSSASNGPTPSHSQEPEKTSHKYLKFPHPRIPIPPIPLKHSNSSASTLNDAQTPGEKRASSSSGRKRLFSGSSIRRPSTSHSGAGDEDNQSIFSMKSDQDLYINNALFKPWISTQPSNSSFWDEATPETVPNSPIHGSTDLGSMSPTLGRTELIKEAPPIMFTSPTLTPGSRQRGFSIRSSGTIASIECDTDSVLSGLSPRSQMSDHSRFHRSNTITTARGNNKLDSLASASPSSTRPRTASSGTPSRKLAQRPSTGQPLNKPTFSDLALEQSFFKSSSSPPPVLTSLPPPPRPKTRPAIITQREVPPPKPTVVTLSAPPARRPKPKMSFEKVIHRRSLLRKPSFLEIDDDDDDDEDGNLMENGRDDVVMLFDEPQGRERRDTDTTRAPPVSASFLDFARESFDTVRSD